MKFRLFRKTTETVKSHAKINLSLQIVGKNDEGYHLLKMVNLPLKLHDVITVSVSDSLRDTFITCDDPSLVNGHQNLCTKAVAAMRREFKFTENFNIDIHKEIPAAAGLGGGSSNAAATMMAINSILKLNASPEKLAEIGVKLGADIPYFFNPKPALLEGVGEIITPINTKKKYYCLIVKPKKGLSTKDVYGASDSSERLSIDTDKVIEGLAVGDDKLIAEGFGNDLYPPAKKILPEVEELVESLKRDGYLLTGMTGSGSAVFALSDDPRKIQASKTKYEKLEYTSIATETML